jgi:hypothetical protein
MVWRVDFSSDKSVVWVDDESRRFIHLLEFHDECQWLVRCGVKDNVSLNQEALYKNRSRAMNGVKCLIKSRS